MPDDVAKLTPLEYLQDLVWTERRLSEHLARARRPRADHSLHEVLRLIDGREAWESELASLMARLHFDIQALQPRVR